jgi:hypothetical protein
VSTGRAALFIWICGASVRSFFAFGAHDLDLMRPEPVKIAISLAQTGRFADPYALPTGLTAHSAPLYPWMLTPIYFLLGATRTADLARVVLAIGVAAVSYALLPFVARALAIPVGAGVLAGFAGALLPAHYWPESNGQFETPFIAVFLELSVILWARRKTPVFAGIWTALGCLLSPVILPPIAALYAVTVFRNRQTALRWTLVAAMAAAVTLAPWIVRGRLALGGWFFVRDNFGLELYASNNDAAVPDIERNVMSRRYQHEHPFTSEKQAAMLRGRELAYMGERQRQAVAWIRANPARFAALSWARFVNFWDPSMLRPLPRVVLWIFNLTAAMGLFVLFRTNRLAFEWLAAMLATFPLIYFVIQSGMRYQHPIYWILMLLCGVTGYELWGRLMNLLNVSGRKRSPASPGAPPRKAHTLALRILAAILFASVARAQPAELSLAAKSPLRLADYINSHEFLDWRILWNSLGLPDPDPDAPRCGTSERRCSTELLRASNPDQAILIVRGDDARLGELYLRYLQPPTGLWQFSGGYSAKSYNSEYPRYHELLQMGGRPFLKIRTDESQTGVALGKYSEHWVDLSQSVFEPAFSFTAQGSLTPACDALGHSVRSRATYRATAQLEEIELVVNVHFTGMGFDIPATFLGDYQRRQGESKFNLRRAFQGLDRHAVIPVDDFEGLGGPHFGELSPDRVLLYAFPKLQKIAPDLRPDAKQCLIRTLEHVGKTPEKRALLDLLR